MNTLRIGGAILLSFLASSLAEGSPLYTTTDLGSGYQVLADAAGQDYGVANSNNSVVYAFDKSPVTQINLRTDTPTTPNEVYILLTLQNGTHQVGYYAERLNGG